METQTVTKKTVKTAKAKTSKKVNAQEMAEKPVVEVNVEAPKKATKSKKKVVIPEPVVEVAPVEEEIVEEVQNSEDAENEANVEFSFDDAQQLLEERIRNLENNFKNQLREIKNGMKHLSKCHTVEKKLQKKKRKSNSNSQTGARMPMVIQDESACAFLGINVGETASRADLMRKIYKYVEENNLKHQDNKRVFSITGDLKKLFPDFDEMKHQEVMGAISRFFPKKSDN